MSQDCREPPRHIITGGSGFVGGYLASTLSARGDRVVNFDLLPPPGVSGRCGYVQGDVRSAGDVAKLRLEPDDIVYHLAARQFHLDVPSRNREAWFADVNVTGTSVLLDAMKRAGTRRLVYFSTDMTYGRPSITPVPADHPQHPIGPYGKSKRDAELLILDAATTWELRATIFRPRLIAGAGRLGILRKLFALIKASLPVPTIGSGRNRYQMIAVEDCVSAALAAVSHGCPPGPFNLGSDKPPIVRDLLRQLIERAGSRSVILPIPAPLLQLPLTALDRVGIPLLYPEQFEIANLDYVLDTSSTKVTLGWNPTRRDQDIIFEAYEGFVAGGRP